MTSLHPLVAVPKTAPGRTPRLIAVLLAIVFSAAATAQEVRYSWLDMSYMNQDFDRAGTQVPIAGQTVDIVGSDGDGVRFRGSVGTWNNLYAFFDYGATDIGVAALVTNDQGQFPAED